MSQNVKLSVLVPFFSTFNCSNCFLSYWLSGLPQGVFPGKVKTMWIWQYFSPVWTLCTGEAVVDCMHQSKFEITPKFRGISFPQQCDLCSYSNFTLWSLSYWWQVYVFIYCFGDCFKVSCGGLKGFKVQLQDTRRQEWGFVLSCYSGCFILWRASAIQFIFTERWQWEFSWYSFWWT